MEEDSLDRFLQDILSPRQVGYNYNYGRPLSGKALLAAACEKKMA